MATTIIEPVSRAKAKAIGSLHYFTGLQCKYGHTSKRLASTGNCIECNFIRSQRPEIKAQIKEIGRRPHNVEASRRRGAEYHKKNRTVVLGKMKARNAIFYQKNKTKIKAQVKAYVANNRDWRRKYANEWNKLKRVSDPQFVATVAARKLVYRVLGISGQKKSKRTAEYLGYSDVELRLHLESLFKPGMTWLNHGEWHIDHMRPLASFDLTDEAQMLAANSLHNLQPLWAEKNMSKSDKWSGQYTLLV